LILFVAEAPGKTEDARGTQLVGPPGRLLREVLSELDLELEDCSKTNAVICRPPRNQVAEVHIDSCRPNLLKTVRTLQPRVIVLLGGAAVRSLIPTERDASVGRVARWVGWTIPSREHQAWICPTYHPSQILEEDRDPVLMQLFRQHLKRAISLEHKKVPGESLDDLKKQVEVIRSPRLARKRLRSLLKATGILAFDYEGNRLKADHPRGRIVSCSFCLNGKDTWAAMMDDSLLPLLSRVLRRKELRKVASNMKHEERWTRRKLGHPVASWYWDTMLAAHVLDNRGDISSLKFQAFIHFGIADYDSVVSHYFEQTDAEGFNHIGDCPTEELLTYNGLDSLLEYKVHLRQRKLMGLPC
jgi:uracil-DNA glycosylase family 4